MNALWITRLSAYRNSSLRIDSAKRLIEIKISRQQALLTKYKVALKLPAINDATTVKDVLLYEARVAKQFWHDFSRLVPNSLGFPGRKPRGKDITNQLLDIGYHHITNRVKRLFETHTISGEIGLLHVARTSKSTPLAYDLVELFRSDIVDAEVLRHLRLKKNTKTILTDKDIAHFLHSLNKRMEKLFYIKEFKQCHSYLYYMELQILKFIKAVNHKEIFEPLHLPRRHDMRCSKKT